MAKKKGRKAELRRLAAKNGWYDGRAERDPEPPTKAVALPFANSYGESPVPWDEEQAYWDGYEEGRDAEPDATNPYAATPNVELRGAEKAQLSERPTPTQG